MPTLERELTGTYAYALDPKGRLVIPAEFRRALGNPLWLVALPRECALVVSEAGWERMRQAPEMQGGAEYWHAGAYCCEVERVTGRILVPCALRHRLGLRRGAEVAVVGHGDAALIYAAPRWAERLDDLATAALNRLIGPIVPEGDIYSI